MAKSDSETEVQYISESSAKKVIERSNNRLTNGRNKTKLNVKLNSNGPFNDGSFAPDNMNSAESMMASYFPGGIPPVTISKDEATMPDIPVLQFKAGGNPTAYPASIINTAADDLTPSQISAMGLVPRNTGTPAGVQATATVPVPPLGAAQHPAAWDNMKAKLHLAKETWQEFEELGMDAEAKEAKEAYVKLLRESKNAIS